MIKLSKRLELIASFIDDNSYVCDVGCDHAHLSIYLVQTKKNIKVLATDINPNPLEIAKSNINKYNLSNKIDLKLQDGIKDLDSCIDTVIISGMGGILISDILLNGNLKNVKTLVLAPNNEFIKVRKTLKKIGFNIVKEKLITENKITYLIIKAKIGNNKLNNFFGTLKNNDLETIYYYTKILNTNTNILKKLPKNKIIKIIKLKIENRRIKKFLNKKS